MLVVPWLDLWNMYIMTSQKTNINKNTISYGFTILGTLSMLITLLLRGMFYSRSGIFFTAKSHT